MIEESLISDMCEAARRVSIEEMSRLGEESIGAAVIGDDGKVYTGKYLRGITAHSTVHAEFAAIINAMMNGSSGIVSAAVFVSKVHHTSTPAPCGACLQAISDYSSIDNIELYACNPLLYPRWKNYPLSSMLPYPWKR